MFASFACNSARACSRVASHSPSMECNGSLSEITVSGSAEEGSRVEEYTESVESESELQKTTMVDAICWDQSSGRSFSDVRATAGRLSRDLAGDPNYI